MKSTETTSNLIYGTSQSTISIIDLRTTRVLTTYQNPAHLGPITSFCVDKKKTWLLVGTLSGVLSLWDLRFGLLLKSWRVGEENSSVGRIWQIAIHPTKGKGKWVIVSFEAFPNEGPSRDGEMVFEALEVWDIELSKKVELFEVIPAKRSKDGEERISQSSKTRRPLDPIVPTDPAAAIEMFLRGFETSIGQEKRTINRRASVGEESFDDDEKQEALFSSARTSLSGPGVRAFLAGVDYSGKNSQLSKKLGGISEDGIENGSTSSGGYIITAGMDRKIRYWDLASPDQCAVVSGLELEEEKPAYR
jgi:phosphoinositide-3-kinase, regulatory subunit 4